ncbi:MAG TPA: CPBP family intramembrane glutamic endopeptidase [Coleofasciculaceae cyanobacterium]|jgi:hypothetical protein
MTSVPSAKPKVAIAAACLYTAVMGIGMFYTKAFQGITYGNPEMMNILWFFMLVGSAVTLFFVIRYFGWQAIGFRTLNPRQLLWFIPLIALQLVMWTFFFQGLAVAPFDAAQWRLFAVAGFTTLLVGINEEIMYRGIVLHDFLATKRVLWAMLVSAIAFSLLHAVNILGGVPPMAAPLQLLSTFLFGCLFAPLMIKLNNIVPLIIFHWLWDFVLFSSSIVSEQVGKTIGSAGLALVPIEIILGVVLWLSIRKDQAVISERVKVPS